MQLSPDVAMEMTFSDPCNKVVTSPSVNAESAVSVPASQLLSGQGYLLARLTHGASWPVLLTALNTLLDRDQSKEW